MLPVEEFAAIALVPDAKKEIPAKIVAGAIVLLKFAIPTIAMIGADPLN